MHLRTWLQLIALAALLVSAPFALAADRPHIVVILADDLGYGDLGCYGAADMRTPHIDGLAASGMRFDHFYANCTVCSPTRAALLTGRYPELVGVPGVIRTHADNNWGHLAPDAVLLPSVLKKAGYHTAIVGKWHLGLESPNTPTERGFDTFRGFLGDMMDDYVTHRRHGINYMRHNEREVDPPGHATDLFTQWAIEYLDERAKAGGPFMLYLAYNAPHTPIQPPDEWVRRVKQREPDMPERRAKLVALIEHMDHGIGQVLAKLESTGLAANTLVVFTSDNGGQSDVGANNGPFRGGKQDLYEGGIRVPTIAAWPGRIKPEARSDRVLITMDLFPTLCDAAGVKVDHAIDGVSFLPTIRGEAQPVVDRDLFFCRREGGERYMGLTIQAIRRGDWKLLQNSPFKPFELYNLKDDPMETTDLAGRERGRYAELAAAMRRQLQRYGAVPWQRADGERDR